MQEQEQSYHLILKGIHEQLLGQRRLEAATGSYEQIPIEERISRALWGVGGPKVPRSEFFISPEEVASLKSTAFEIRRWVLRYGEVDPYDEPEGNLLIYYTGPTEDKGPLPGTLEAHRDEAIAQRNPKYIHTILEIPEAIIAKYPPVIFSTLDFQERYTLRLELDGLSGPVYQVTDKPLDEMTNPEYQIISQSWRDLTKQLPDYPLHSVFQT